MGDAGGKLCECCKCCRVRAPGERCKTLAGLTKRSGTDFPWVGGMHIQSPLPFRSRAGYSMAEILAALVIAGILMALAWPRLSAFGGISRRSSALNQIVADVGFAQMSAVRNGAEAQIKFNATGTGYTVVVRNDLGVLTTVKTVPLTRDYPGLTVRPLNDSLVFDSRGLRRNGTANQSISVWMTTPSGTVSDTILITPLGKVNRVR